MTPKKFANIISLDNYRRRIQKWPARNKLLTMTKTALLEQLLSFYEDVKKDPFDINTALYGEDLMEVIAQRCLTRELHDLAETYLEKGPHAAFKLENFRN